MSAELSPEERSLLADESKPRRGRARRAEEAEQPKAEVKTEAPDPTVPTPAQKPAERGPMSPAQWDDDGWGQTPIQMRG